MTPEAAKLIVAKAAEFATNHKIFACGCSGMVRAAYLAGGITIYGKANMILNGYPRVTSPEPGDIAGWRESPNGHVVIVLGPNLFATCPGEGKATKINRNMGPHHLTYVRPRGGLSLPETSSAREARARP
jgi:hypothetical protein